MLTKLEAVNAILRNLGVSSVTTIDNIANPDVQAAVDALETKRKTVQATSWWFNTQESITLPLTVDNEILIANNVMQVNTPDGGIDVIQHGTRLFNRDNNSYKFDAPLTDVWMVYVHEWDELPYSVREVIQYSAMMQVQSDFEGDQEKLNQVEGQLQGSFLTMKREHVRNRKVNIYSNPRSARLLTGPHYSNNNPYRIGG